MHTEYGPDCKLWKERKKRRRAWHSFDEARTILTSIPENVQRPELMEILVASEKLTKDIGTGVLPLNNLNALESPDEEDEEEEDDEKLN